LNDIPNLQSQVREAVETGKNIQDLVRDLTLRQVSAHTLNLDSLRQITEAVVKGARAGVEQQLQASAQQTELAKTSLHQAVSGLDTALAQIANASKLALQEAASRAQTFSNQDLSRAKSDMESLEKMFVETLQTSANAAKDSASQILGDLAKHAQVNGSAVGAQLRDTLTVMTEQMTVVGKAQIQTGLQLAQVTSDLLRQMAAGMLTGVADHLKTPPRKN
jgi:hypothetical protein